VTIQIIIKHLLTQSWRILSLFSTVVTITYLINAKLIDKR
jgi:hypothetical protein